MGALGPKVAAVAERLRIEREVERLIALLDVLDGDPDLEDGDEDDQCDDEGVDTDREPDADYELPAAPFIMDQSGGGTLWAR